MRYLIMALCLLFACPAWAGGCDPCWGDCYENGLPKTYSVPEPWVVTKDSGVSIYYPKTFFMDGGKPIFGNGYKFFDYVITQTGPWRCKPDDNGIIKCHQASMTIEVPDMNGDGIIDEQDKRLAECAVEEFKRKYESK